MTDFYSNHYSAEVGETGHFTTLSTPVRFLSPGIKHSRVRRTAAYLTVPAAQDLDDDDVIRLLDLKSSDRLIELFFSMDANWGATTTFNVGLYKKGSANNGAVIDEDLFGSAIDWSGEIARVDYFDEAGTLDDWDRGKALWELAAIGAASYTSDPGEIWTVTAQTTQDISATAAAVEMLVEAYYVAGD